MGFDFNTNRLKSFLFFNLSFYDKVNVITFTFFHGIPNFVIGSLKDSKIIYIRRNSAISEYSICCEVI